MMRCSVLDAVTTRGLNFVVVQLISGEVAMGMILGVSGQRWRIGGFATESANDWRAGRRVVSLIPLHSGEGRLPTIGAILEEVDPLGSATPPAADLIRARGTPALDSRSHALATGTHTMMSTPSAWIRKHS